MALTVEVETGEPPIRSLDIEPLSAPAFAKEIQATLRQVQIWTDNTVVHCVPGTRFPGRGSRRLYDPIELPIGAVAAVLARCRFQIGMIKNYADACRNFLFENQPEDLYTRRSRDWFRRAQRGKFASWIVCVPQPIDGTVWVGWEDEKHLPELLKTRRAGIVINVQAVISPFVQ